MTPDDLASRLLDVQLGSDPLTGSFLGLSAFDDQLPNLTQQAQDEVVAALRQVASEVAQLEDADVDEEERQTIDLVRASAAAVPLVELTVGDFFRAPVTHVLTMLPKVPLDNAERAGAYFSRLRGLPLLLETAAARHRNGVASGLLPVRRLVEGAIAQLDTFLTDPDVGGHSPRVNGGRDVHRTRGPLRGRHRAARALRVPGDAGVTALRREP